MILGHLSFPVSSYVLKDKRKHRYYIWFLLLLISEQVQRSEDLVLR